LLVKDKSSFELFEESEIIRILSVFVAHKDVLFAGMSSMGFIWAYEG
jgi:hypothetical protein